MHFLGSIGLIDLHGYILFIYYFLLFILLPFTCWELGWCWVQLRIFYCRPSSGMGPTYFLAVFCKHCLNLLIFQPQTFYALEMELLWISVTIVDWTLLEHSIILQDQSIQHRLSYNQYQFYYGRSSFPSRGLNHHPCRRLQTATHLNNLLCEPTSRVQGSIARSPAGRNLYL